MDKEKENFDDELEIGEVEEFYEDDDEEIEAYDFNEGDESEAGAEESDEDEEPTKEESPETAEADESETQEDGAEESDKVALTADQARELVLLHKLGYEGDYDTARAAFERDQAEGASGAETPAGDEERPEPPAVDYEAMAKAMLDEINKEFGLELSDYSEFEDLAAFAELSQQKGIGAVKAFRATNPKLMEKLAMKAAMSKLSKPTRNVKALPAADGGKGGTSRGENISAAKIAEYKQMFPHMSRSEIIRLITKANKSVR